MGFADAYLDKGALFPLRIQTVPARDTGIIIVIPAYDEPLIGLCLDSLASCHPPGIAVEVIVVVNSPQASGQPGLRANAATLKSIGDWQGTEPAGGFTLHVIDAGQPSIKGWGVGAARKTGMDEAVRRFNLLKKPNGVIVSLDADCTVSENYLQVLWNEFGLNERAGGCSVNFEHRDREDGLEDRVAHAIRQYELHLRFWVAGLKYAGFPYPYHTIGSAIAVKALRYVRAGGMSRRQGGEDFYFVQKLVGTDDFIEIKNARVFPSARLSNRVPFGTGPALSTLMEKPEAEFLSYNPEAFSELASLFALVNKRSQEVQCIGVSYHEIPEAVHLIVSEQEWIHKMDELLANTSNGAMFLKRFYSWFNSFMVVKYLNKVHSVRLDRMRVVAAAARLTEMFPLYGGVVHDYSLEGLLSHFRMVDSL